MAYGDGYRSQVGPGGSPQLSGVSAEAMGAGIGQALENAGNALDHVAIRAHAIETQENRRSQLLGSQASLAQAGADSDTYVRDLPKTSAPDKIKENGLNDWDERTRDLVPADPKAAEHFSTIVAEQRAQLSNRLDAMQAGALAGHQTTNAMSASNSIVNRAILQPDTETVGSSLDAADQLVGTLDQLDPDKREQFRQQLHGQIYAGVVGALNNAGKPGEAAAWLSREPVQAALKPEQMDALVTQTRVAQDRITSQNKAAAGADFETKSGALELQAQQLTQGRPSFDQAKGMAASYATLAATAPTPEKKTSASLKAQEWQARTTEIAASEGYRGASPVDRQARIAALAAKPSLSPAEGAELKGLQGQQSYVNGLDTLGRYAYSTGKAVAPIDWNDPGSIQQRTATWAAAQSQFGGAPAFLLPGEEAPLKEIMHSGSNQAKVAAMQTIMQLPGTAASSVINTVAGNDVDLNAAAKLAVFHDGGERMLLALQGAEALKANREIWTRQKDPTGKHFLGPTHDQLWASWAPAFVGLDSKMVSAIQTNTFNLYAANAAKAGWSNFKPDELGRALRFALGGGKSNGGDVGGFGSWNGAPVLLPSKMGQTEFEQRLSRATAPQWGAAAINGLAWVGDQKSGRALTTGEARGLRPVLVDPTRGLYMLYHGNTAVTVNDGRKPFLFDINRLPGTAAPMAAVSAPDADLTAIMAHGGIR